jgi:hypothetical protein
MNASSEIPDGAGAARLRELERLAAEKLTTITSQGVQNVSSQVTGRPGGQQIAPSDRRISGTKNFDVTDKTLVGIKSRIGDIQTSPKSGGWGTSPEIADAPTGKLP